MLIYYYNTDTYNYTVSDKEIIESICEFLVYQGVIPELYDIHKCYEGFVIRHINKSYIYHTNTKDLYDYKSFVSHIITPDYEAFIRKQKIISLSL